MKACSVIDSVARPGPPSVSTFGRSTILKASIMRIRTTVAATGAIAGQVMSRKICKAAGAVELGRLDLVAWLGLESRQQDDEDERGPLPGVAEDDDQARRPGFVAQPIRRGRASG